MCEILLPNVKSSLRWGEIAAAVDGFNFTETAGFDFTVYQHDFMYNILHANYGYDIINSTFFYVEAYTMTKVTLLGDSIRLIGYGKMAAALLGEDFTVFQPSENCRFAKYTLRGLFDWAEQMEGSRIVHWNNGLWDTCNLFDDGAFSSEDEYISTMLRIADILLARYDKVIFATTTPVSPRNKFIKNDVIERYNQIIVPKLREKGVIINDLYTLVAEDIDGNIADDLIHLSEKGIKLCAEQVAGIIRSTAGTLAQKSAERQTGQAADYFLSAPI